MKKWKLSRIFDRKENKMVIEISRDIEQYKESVVFGLTAKQLIYSIVSVGIGGGLVLLLYQYIGLTASAYVAIPVVAPIALGGFYTYNGMSFKEVMKRKIQMLFFNRALTYISTEGETEVKNYLREKENRLKQSTKKDLRRAAWTTILPGGRKRG